MELEKCFDNKFQGFLKVEVNGYLGPDTVKALCRRVNER